MALRFLESWSLLLAMLLLAACAGTQPKLIDPQDAQAAALPARPSAEAPTLAPTAEPAATAAQTASPSPSAVPLPEICSPLSGIPLAGLPDLISNPYHPPRPGFDDPHAGVDLAVMLAGNRVAVPGNPVTAAFAGRVVMSAADRFPFGNALIIETPLDRSMESLLASAALPTVAPTLLPLSALTCPPYPSLEITESSARSLYILYGHLRDAPAGRQGDTAACGQEIGAVGDSGNALNPHLHFETRVGPSGIYLNPMAHYDASARSEEMSAYCLWSVSGLFQLVDPMQVLGAGVVPANPQ